MTDRPTLEDLDAVPDDGPWCCTGNAEDCALCAQQGFDMLAYPWICPGHERTAANERIVGEATEATEPCDGGICTGSDCSHERAADALTVHAEDADLYAFTAMRVPPSRLVIDGAHGPLVTIHLDDGRLEYGPGYTPDEAARRFWDAVRKHTPELKEGQS
ncbi:hypothetical protein [Streptomyces sp. NPDC052535]|uniref:hypothetical protein n=1 Tax=Streptomyces sp. NPDC052535 TaxID=3155531 RepID=UPI0034248936